MMNVLKSQDPERQTVIEHLDKIYSIVDLHIMPKELNGERLNTEQVKNMLQMAYPSYKYELAEITDDKTMVIGRFRSIPGAKLRIRSLNA